MNGHDARSAGTAGHGRFQRLENRRITARRDLDVTGRGVAHPAGNTEFHRPVADEEPEPNPLYPAADSEVDDGHLREWLASASEERREDRGDRSGVSAGRGTWEQENFAATKLARHEFKHLGRCCARSMTASLDDIFVEREAGLDDVVRGVRWLRCRRGRLRNECRRIVRVRRQCALEPWFVDRDRPPWRWRRAARVHCHRSRGRVAGARCRARAGERERPCGRVRRRRRFSAGDRTTAYEWSCGRPPRAVVFRAVHHALVSGLGETASGRQVAIPTTRGSPKAGRIGPARCHAARKRRRVA